MAITLVLGRDGMGDADESEFQAWVGFVTDLIDKRAGLDVQVEERGSRDVQTDDVRGGSDEQRAAIVEAKASLWDQWCAEGAP